MPEEHVAEPGALHQRRERLAVIGNRRGHPLHEIVDVVQPGVDDRLAQRLEAMDVERDVVVDDEEHARAAGARIADVVDDARIGKRWKLRPRISMIEQKLQSKVQPREVSMHVDLPAHEGVAGEPARAAVGRPHVVQSRTTWRSGLWWKRSPSRHDSPAIAAEAPLGGAARSRSRAPARET